MSSSIDIYSDQALRDLCAAMAGQPFVAMDTEFIRERTYWPILALVQVSWPGQDPVLIDPLPIEDWEPLHVIMRNPGIRKVFHSARQDLEIFYQQMKEMPAGIFDTQIAASMCGFGDQISYSALVNRLLDVMLPKGNSFTNWLQRPLTAEQIRYARDDVLYLPGVYNQLRELAVSRGRLAHIEEEIGLQLHPGLFDPDPDQLWRKVKKAGSLRQKDLPVLQALAAWRDQTAQRQNKPVRFVISDEVLVELAKVPTLTLEGLKARRGLHPRMLGRYADDMIQLHAEARAKPKSEWPHSKQSGRPPSDKSESLADLVWLLIKEIAHTADMSPANIILKRDLPGYIDALIFNRDTRSYPIEHGWRRDLVGQPLRNLLKGQLIIKVKRHRIVWEEKAENGKDPT